MNQTTNPNPDPLYGLVPSAEYLSLKNPRSISVMLFRKTYPLLNKEVVYMGRRPHFRQSTLEKFIKSRTGAALGEPIPA